MVTCKILGHNVEIIETSDENLLEGRDGTYDCSKLQICIRKDSLPSCKDRILFHEIYEMILAFVGTSYDHHDFRCFAHLLWATLTENGLLNPWFRATRKVELVDDIGEVK